MTSLKKWMLLPAAIVAAACGRSDAPRVDDALKNDLALAAQAQPYQAQQFVSPQEMGYGYSPYGLPQQYQANQRLPYGYPQAQPVAQRATAVRRTASRSSGTRVIYRDPPEPVRNTKRDAIIGAAAGAVLGASTSRDKIKGGLIGAAAGAVLGGIIGHTVDVQKP